MKAKDTVYPTGSGPGDEDLPALRGAELHARADAVNCGAFVRHGRIPEVQGCHGLISGKKTDRP
jgi:hypothetical protein